MAQSNLNNQDIKKGKERRAHVRHPISVSIEVMIEGVSRITGTARDFCAGGLLLIFDNEITPPASGTVSLLKLNVDGEDYRLRAKVAYAEAANAGFSFINPDSITLDALMAHANRYKEVTTTPQTHDEHQQPNKSSFAGKSKKELIEACNKHITAALDKLFVNFLEAVSTRLLQAADKTDDVSVRNDNFQAIENINTHKGILISSFFSSINNTLADLKPKQKDLQAASEVSVDSLAIIGDEEFDIWLATAKLIHRVEGDYKQILGLIEHRLSIVFGESVNRQNNPYGPYLFSQAFHSAIESLDLKNSVLNSFHDAFRGSLLQCIGDIYEKINNTLIEHDVAPDMKIIVANRNQKVNPEPVPHNEDQETIQHNHVAIQDNPDPAEESASKPETNTALTQQNLYELVGELRSLQNQLHGQTSLINPNKEPPQHSTTQLAPSVNKHISTFTNQEVQDLIKDIKSIIPANGSTSNSLTNVRELIETRINGQSGENTKVLSNKQNQTIDITENLLESLLNDLQVAQSVRPWINQLGLPVMMMALNDDTVLEDKTHVVRQVINKLSNLEILATSEDKEEQAAVKQAFQWLTNLINNEFDGTPDVFNRVEQQLDILLKVQQQTYESNIKEVIDEVLEVEKTQATTPEVTEEIREKEQQDPRLRQVHRLQEGHWVLFDTFSNEPRRLKVAWIVTNKGKYVFVNVMGRKDRIIVDSELADLFRNGSAVVLDGQDDPAMDRAQYSMLQNMHKQLLYQSSHDELTGLINRREFEITMRHALEDAVQNSTRHAICYLDLDKFKIINNNFGFDAGDKLINECIGLFKAPMDEHNVLARIGPDQFAILLQETSMDDAVEFMEDLLAEVQEYRFHWEDNHSSITFSAGIAMINTSTVDTMQLLQDAESSCNIAKEMGGNRIQIYNSGPGRISRRKKEMEWASKIDKPLDENNLFLRCQKILPIQSHLDPRPHYEILLGLPDELGGGKSLEAFIQAAEQYNRMYDIDKWVIANSFQWLAKNEDIVSDIHAFTINLSGQSLNNNALIEYIYKQVNESSVPIERVCFEITETAGISNLSDAADFIQTIKETGCQFALDDFGSGMSSYSYLRNLPVDYLKVDGVFIKDILNSKSDYAVVKSIVEIAHFMEKTVIAEFVQDDESISLLRDIGVDYVQGFGIAKPHQLDELLS